MTDAWINETWSKISAKMLKTVERNQNTLPYTAVDGRYDNWYEKDVSWWTNGFWPGIMWLMYSAEGNEAYKTAAENSEKLLDKAMENFNDLMHDVGFMWYISAGANYKLTGNKDSLRRVMHAANLLAGRYNINGRFIRAWNGDMYGWAIIDCMMNLPLLYFASRESGDNRFYDIAVSHADTTLKNHLRPDGSARHIINYDTHTGEIVEVMGGQGYDEHSSWSRGQAWALYGFALSYKHTGDKKYLDAAKRSAHYFISCVCDDWLPRCDFRAPEEPVIYDSTAGACAACGLLEIAENVPENEKRLYYNAAVNILKAMDEKFCDWDAERDSILQCGTERYHGEKGRHIPIIYGDYFFIEAIYRLKGFNPVFWY